MKKSQTEIMGLAIVVILLIVGVTFVLKFMIEREPIEFKKQFTQSEIASNTINTFLKTTSKDCNELSMTELLQDCGQSESIICPNGDSSCMYVNNTANIILSQTLDKLNVKYELKVFHSENNPIITIGTACLGSKKSKTFPIPTASGTLFVKLDVCD